MKDPSVRTKVVLRHLPPTLSQSALMEQIDARFADRHKWFSFYPGKNSHKHQKYSRAYIEFKTPEDVIEFAEFFNGHVFVNEKGTQVKAIVEYAPSQRVPKLTKKDNRDGGIFKDPDYLKFLEFLAKPVENLPSAEIQLERREAERAVAGREPPIVTPLMDFVRQKRAAKSGTQRLSTNGKSSRRPMGASPGSSRPSSSRRGGEKRRASTPMYVMRDSTRNATGKEKPTYILAPRREDSSASDKPISATAESGAEPNAEESGASGTADPEKKKVILLKGKERENAHSYAGASQQSGPSVRNSAGSLAFRENQRRGAGGKMIKGILINKEARQNQSSAAVHSEQPSQILHIEKEKRPPRSTNIRSILKDHLPTGPNAMCSLDGDIKRAADVIGSDPHGPSSFNEKQERRTRNKDRPDRSVWSHRRSDGSDETLSLSESLEGLSIAHHSPATGVNKLGGDIVDSSGKHRNISSNHSGVDVPNSVRSGEAKTLGNIRSGSSIENGSHRHVGRRGQGHGMKDVDGSLYSGEGKPPKRGGASGYGSHEKQVWVQKSGSGS